ncbi:5-hydroxyisourate hydrolase [Episyrphus balteatus]|uniref:5-hydroxyisourate hydrolase n=1 Tax=Episyrphus balteatus TaxID=286459 RepID=UPI002484DDBC|nr:5-hydroxyisourate hydrolase [Episyrphus balteatus]
MSIWERVRLRVETIQNLDEVKMVDDRTLSTHILDTSKGLAAANVPITIFRLENDSWIKLSQSETDNDGRVSKLLTLDQFQSGIFKLSFDVRKYFEANQVKSFYPLIEVVVECERGQHYHVPLLLNPFGYSTYRGT